MNKLSFAGYRYKCEFHVCELDEEIYLLCISGSDCHWVTKNMSRSTGCLMGLPRTMETRGVGGGPYRLHFIQVP